MDRERMAIVNAFVILSDKSQLKMRWLVFLENAASVFLSLLG